MIAVPSALTCDPTVSDRAVRVWCRLDMQPDGEPINVAKIASDIGISPSLLRRALRELVAAGWMTVEKRLRAPSIYELVYDHPTDSRVV
jgi:predicted transcriptional regulator